MNASKKLVLALAIAGAIGMISAPSYGGTNGGGSSGGGGSGDDKCSAYDNRRCDRDDSRGWTKVEGDAQKGHLVCYDVSYTSDQKWQKVRVTNQFGKDVILKIGPAKFFCVPTNKTARKTIYKPGDYDFWWKQDDKDDKN